MENHKHTNQRRSSNKKIENPYKLEICANSALSCVKAEEGGAWRVELCAAIPEGGTTPSYGEILTARRLTSIKLHVIIRPRGGDFLYSDMEIKTMLQDIRIARNLGADGIVIGCLTPEGEVDMAQNAELIEAAEGMSVTFHRAFDMTRDPLKSLENIIELGCDRILTSGCRQTAEQGALFIRQLVQQADDRIIIMPGSGINADNVEALARLTGAREFHLSARSPIESQMQFRNPNVSMGGTNITIDEYAQPVTDPAKVAETLQRLNEAKTK